MSRSKKDITQGMPDEWLTGIGDVRMTSSDKTTKNKANFYSDFYAYKEINVKLEISRHKMNKRVQIHT